MVHHQTKPVKLFRNLGAGALMFAATPGAIAQDKTREVSIRFENLTASQLFTSIPVVTHREDVHLWMEGQKADLNLQVLAEEGNPDYVLVEALLKTGKDYGEQAIALPILPGQSRSVQIKIGEVHPRVSAAWMLGFTNDGFAGINGVDVYNVKKPVTIDVYALDSGSRKNSEKKEFTAALGSRTLDPEDGVVHRHEGIRGDAGIPATYKFDPKAPVARVTITPVKTGP